MMTRNGQAVTVECESKLTPEAVEVFDRMSWDEWAADVGERIATGDVIKAASAVLLMCRFAASVQLSDYGAETVKNCINQFYVKYGGGDETHDR